jgi:hypothetical protein
MILKIIAHSSVMLAGGQRILTQSRFMSGTQSAAILSGLIRRDHAPSHPGSKSSFH